MRKQNGIYPRGLEILQHPDCTVSHVAIDWDAAGSGVIPGGSPMSAAGRVANDSAAIGILRYNVYRGIHRTAPVVIGGYVDLEAAQANSGMNLSAEAKGAMPNLWFSDGGSRMGGGGLPTGGAAYQQLVTDGEGNTKWEDRLAYDYSRAVVADGYGQLFVHVSDDIGELNATDGATLYFHLDDGSPDGHEGTGTLRAIGDLLACKYCFIALTDNIDAGGFVVPKRGVYLYKNESTFVSSVANFVPPASDTDPPPEPIITWDGSVGEIKKIPDKLIEKDVFVVSAHVTYPSSAIDSADKTFSEIMSAARQNKRCILVIDRSGTILIYEMCPLNDYKENEIKFRSFEFSNIDSYDSGFSGTEYIVTSENKWSYEYFDLSRPITSSRAQDITGVKTFGKDCLVINSSTSGSTKKFKITVDDSGTISATEV